MSEEHFTIELDVVDWRCDYCGHYCKPTGNIEKEFIGVKVEHMCMNPACGVKVMLDTNYPQWESLTHAIAKNRP